MPKGHAVLRHEFADYLNVGTIETPNYVLMGYGFTTRVFSVGLFTSNGRGNRVFGCKFGFELFRKW